MFDDNAAIVPIGKTISYCTTANGTYIALVGTTTITPPERERGKAEYTNDNSPGKVKQYKSALVEPGTSSATYKYQPAQFAALEVHNAAGTTLFWKIETPDEVLRSFKGFITKHNEGELGLEEVPDVELEIQLDGVMDYDADPE